MEVPLMMDAQLMEEEGLNGARPVRWRECRFITALTIMGSCFVYSIAVLSAQVQRGAIGKPLSFLEGYHGTRQRVFLHLADPHADPFYDYREFFAPAPKISRSPLLYSKDEPSEVCPWSTEGLVFEYWNKTGGGPKCPCGHFGANPPFAILDSLRHEIEKQKPEFIIIGGDFASHYEPGTAKGDHCSAARASAKATVSMINSRSSGIQYLWAWGNNDVLPKREPLTQEWLEEFGAHLLEVGWLKTDEMNTWNKGGYYRRNMGEGLCVISLNSNSWTLNQINEAHHASQLEWFSELAFTEDSTCEQFLLNAHVPLGWLMSGSGHHQWDNLKAAEATDYSEMYRKVIDRYAPKIIAELYGHINKADIRLMSGKHSPEADKIGGSNDVEDDNNEDEVADLGDDIGGDASTVSFTVAGISRRGMNDPQFQRIYLDEVPGATYGSWKYQMQDIEVFSMKGSSCDFDFRYSLRDVFRPHFDTGITTSTLKNMVSDKRMLAVVEKYIALTESPYTKATLKDPEFIKEVREGRAGCESREDEWRRFSDAMSERQDTESEMITPFFGPAVAGHEPR